MHDLNLARRPFLNARPVQRLGLLLLVVGVALTVWNTQLYWNHFTGEGKTRSRSQDLAREVAAEQEEIRRLEQQIASLDIDDLNRRTRFINGEIDRRRFGWSRLFERVASVQPGAVRLVSLMPRFEEKRARDRRARAGRDEVSLDLRGVARSGEAILEFIDNLFAHPAFASPDLSRETKREDGTVDFVLSVLYLPSAEDEHDGEDRAASSSELDGETAKQPAEGEGS